MKILPILLKHTTKGYFDFAFSKKKKKANNLVKPQYVICSKKMKLLRRKAILNGKGLPGPHLIMHFLSHRCISLAVLHKNKINILSET